MEQQRVQVICPACQRRVEAVVSKGRVKGYCAVARLSVNFLIEEQPITEIKADISEGVTSVRANRDSKGRFTKKNVPRSIVNANNTIFFTCKFCGNQKPFKQMQVVSGFFPLIVACRDCCKRL